MATNEDSVRILVGLAGKIFNELKRSMQDVGQGFTKHLANLSTHQYSRGMTGSSHPFKFRN